MKINVSDAEGQILAEPVVNQAGTIILPANVTITPALINALTRQGIDELEVVEQLSNQVQDDFIAHIEEAFAQFEGPHMNELKHCLIEHFSQEH